MKQTLVVSVLTLAIIGIIGWGILSRDSSAIPSILRDDSHLTSDKRIVTTSFYPLFFFASEVGGDEADISNVVPSGAEPHEYEPTPGERARIEKSDLLILNGGGLEPWGDDVREALEKKGVLTVVAGEGLMTRAMEDEEGKLGSTGVVDPHVWLSPLFAEKMVDRILSGFLSIDPEHADLYRQNAAVLKKSLADLDAEYRKGLSNCKTQSIVTSHAAFGYLADTYGLTQVSIAGISPEEEPSPSALAEIADFAKTHEVSYIFFESLVSPKLAETIASEVGAKTLTLNPIEGLTDEEIAAGENYLTIMQQNLNHLRIALQCQ